MTAFDFGLSQPVPEPDSAVRLTELPDQARSTWQRIYADVADFKVPQKEDLSSLSQDFAKITDPESACQVIFKLGRNRNVSYIGLLDAGLAKLRDLKEIGETLDFLLADGNDELKSAAKGMADECVRLEQLMWRSTHLRQGLLAVYVPDLSYFESYFHRYALSLLETNAASGGAAESLKQTTTEIAALASEYRDIVNARLKSVGVTVNPGELKILQPDKSELIPVSSEDGQACIRVNSGNFLTLTSKAPSPELARRIFTALTNLESPDLDKLDSLASRILTLRQVEAYLMGADSFLSLKLSQGRGISNVEDLNSLLNKARSANSKALSTWYDSLQELARRETEDPHYNLTASEIDYWRLRQACTAHVAQGSLQVDFNTGLSRALEVLEKVTGYKMKLFPGETRETSIPHTHRVVVFDNEGFVELGTILIDAYTRPGKRGLAFTSCLKRCSGTNPVTRTSALALISLALPADSQELGLDKTWELMHEFGHALSVVCVRSELLCQSGFDVPVDCVEGISTFFQKLATNKEVLEHIFKQPISKAAIQAMLQAGVWQEAKNIAYATIDYYLHTCSPRGLGSIYRYGQNVAQNIWQLQLPNNWGMTLTHWGRRIFTEGDESRYYMYVMGEPLAQGLQGRVDAAGGLGSPGGQAIVRNVLERGHTRPILETFLN